MYDDVTLGSGSFTIDDLVAQSKQEKKLILEVKLTPNDRKLIAEQKSKAAYLTLRFSVETNKKSPLKPPIFAEDVERKLNNENGLSPGTFKIENFYIIIFLFNFLPKN